MSRFIIIPRRVLSDQRLSSMTHLRVLMAIGTHTDRNGWAYVHRKTLADGVGVSRARISQCVSDLREWGYVEVAEQKRDSDGGQTCNLYRVLFDVGAPEVTDAGDEVLSASTQATKRVGRGVSTANPPVSDANPPVSNAYPPVNSMELTPQLAPLTPQLAPCDLPPRKSLAFTPVVNDGFNDKSSSNAREGPPVDNSEAERLLLPDDEKTETPGDEAGVIAPPDAEVQLLAALNSMPRASFDAKADRLTLLTWVSKGVTPAELAAAYERALKRRARKGCDKFVSLNFLDCLIADVLAERDQPGESARDSPEVPWHDSSSGVAAQGMKVNVPARPNESTPSHLVRVAAASGRGPWIEAALRRARAINEAFYRQAFDYFKDLDLLDGIHYAL